MLCLFKYNWFIFLFFLDFSCKRIVRWLASRTGENLSFLLCHFRCRQSVMSRCWVGVTICWGRRIYQRRSRSSVVLGPPVSMCSCCSCLATPFFAGKNSKTINLMWMLAIRDLANIGTWAWGAMGLAFLYEQLSLTSSPHVSAVGGYMSLLVVIYFFLLFFIVSCIVSCMTLVC